MTSLRSPDELYDHENEDGPDGCGQDGTNPTATKGQSDVRKDPTRDEGAEDPDDNVADQAKAVQLAVETKNGFHNASIFRGIILTYVPEWVYDVVPREELDAKRKSIINERLAKLAELDAEVAKAAAPKAQIFEIVPVK